MLNLMGYHYQGSASKSDDHGEGEFLILPPFYNSVIKSSAAKLSFPDFLSGKKCYIGYGEPIISGELYNLSGQITKYYGPYYFNFGLAPISIDPDWKEHVARYIIKSGEILTDTSACCTPYAYALFCYVGTPAETAGWTTTLPEDAFCANNNRGYAREDAYFLAQAVPDYYNSKFKLSGGQYKLNGRYAATGSGGGSVNIDTGLKQYEGYKPWATGWLYTGETPYSYIRNQHPLFLQPKCNRYPFQGEYSNGEMDFIPNLQIADSFDYIFPSCSTKTITGAVATCSVIRWEKLYMIEDFLVEKGCGAWGVNAGEILNIIRNRFDKKNYSYPNTEMFQPIYHFSYLLTSSKIEVI